MIHGLFPLSLVFNLFVSAAASAVSDTAVINIQDDIEITRIAENTYIHTTYSVLPEYGKVPANGLVYIQDRKAYIINTPWTDNQADVLVRWIEDNMAVTVKGIIVTHWHNDCMGGLKRMHALGIRSYSLEKTREIARNKGLPVPDIGFADSLTLPLSDRSIVCWYAGSGHTIDNIVVWLPEEKVLFAGCLVKSLESKTLGNLADADMEAWPSTLQHLLGKFTNCHIVVPGHGAYGGVELIHHTIQLLEQQK